MSSWSLYKLAFPNGKLYIGIAMNVKARWRGHQTLARSGRGYAVHRAIAAVGWSNVTKSVLCVGSEAYIKELETKVIAALASRPPTGYNLTAGGDGASGKKFTQEERQKIRLRMMGNSHTTGTKRSEDAIRRGWQHSEETKAKIAAGNRGKLVSAATKEKLSVAATARPAWTEERRAAHSEMLKGNGRKKGVATSESQKEAHKNFFVRVREFCEMTGFQGSKKHINKAMLDEHDRRLAAV